MTCHCHVDLFSEARSSAPRVRTGPPAGPILFHFSPPPRSLHHHRLRRRLLLLLLLLLLLFLLLLPLSLVLRPCLTILRGRGLPERRLRSRGWISRAFLSKFIGGVLVGTPTRCGRDVLPSLAAATCSPSFPLSAVSCGTRWRPIQFFTNFYPLFFTLTHAGKSLTHCGREHATARAPCRGASQPSSGRHCQPCPRLFPLKKSLLSRSAC